MDTMNDLKIAIFREIRLANEEASMLPDDQLEPLIFWQRNSLRLTFSGFTIVKKIFTAYSFAIPDTLKSRHRYGMSRMEYPYFFTNRRLILFSEMDAAMVTMHGDIVGFLETYSQIDK